MVSEEENQTAENEIEIRKGEIIGVLETPDCGEGLRAEAPEGEKNIIM